MKNKNYEIKGDNPKRILIVIAVALLFININSVSAHGEEIFAQAEEIIKQKIPCENMTESQLEILGDYYMEQMHPGELHEVMDERMGGEGSESLIQVHINMGKAFYCGESGAMSVGMMNTMMGRNMMAGYSLYQNKSFNWFYPLAIAIILVLLVLLILNQTKKKNERK